MIDIHCHLLYRVDDGAHTIEESVEMLKEAKRQGIRAMILTPHYRHGMFGYPLAKVEEHYKNLLPYAKKLGIILKLGTEYHVNSDIVEAIKVGRCHTLADTKFVLTEYKYETQFSYIKKMSQELILNGYIPVIAHVERYACMTEDIDAAEELQDMGAWIQINADAVVGNHGRKVKKYCKKMLQAGYVDVIASDSHGIKERVCNMEDCYKYISKKFGEDYAEELMDTKPAQILSGNEE